MPSSPIHLVFVIARLNRGGTEVQLLELARSLDPKIFKLSLLCFYPNNQLWEEANQIPGLHCVALKKKSRWDIFFFFSFLKELRQLKPNVIYSFLPTGNLLSLFALPLLPKTKLIWGIRSCKINFSHFDSFSKWVWKLECYLSRFTTLIITNSNAGKSHAIASGARKKNFEVVPNGIDTDKFKPDEKVRSNIRERLGVASGEFLIGTVGRFDPLKDHFTFLTAASEIALKKKNVKFILVGVRETDNAKLKELANRPSLFGKVIFTGPVASSLAYYQAMDLYCSSSQAEEFSNSIAEAMATGLSSVVTDVGDSKFIVGETGWVVEPRDAKALASGILFQPSRLEFAGDEMRAAARNRITKNFSRDKLGENFTKVLAQKQASVIS